MAGISSYMAAQLRPDPTMPCNSTTTGSSCMPLRRFVAAKRGPCPMGDRSASDQPCTAGARV